MNKEEQKKTPLFTKLLENARSEVYPFDVPGHRMGATPSELKDALGEFVMRLDVNAPRGLDSLGHPQGVIKEAQALMADAYGADEAFFLINGSSCGILTMIMSSCASNDKIIMPRNVHKSAINGLILSGAIPVFINPDIDTELGIANGVSFENVKQTIDENPDAKAIFIINPTYFGVVSDLKRIVDYANKHDLIVLVDEAHGSHFPFSTHFPISAMGAGADMSTCSIHKTSGSLTQSSCLFLKGDKVTKNRVQTVLNILQSTSPNYILLASLDAARKKLVFEGETIFSDAIKLADYCRREINKIPGLRALGKDYFSFRGFNKFDHTKLVIKVNDLGFTGFEIFTMLRNDYNIQPELAEINVILFIFGIGIEKKSVDYLIASLKSLSKKIFGQKEIFLAHLPSFKYPESRMRPRDAFHAPKKFVDSLNSLGEISGESIMIYPPGIPLIVPGEVISSEVIELFRFYETQDTITLTDNNDGMIKVVDMDEYKEE